MSEYDRIDVLYLGSELMTGVLQERSIKVSLEIDDLEDREKDKELLDRFLGVGKRITTPKLIGVFLWISGENRKRKRKAQESQQIISDLVGQIERQLGSDEKGG